MQIEGSVVVVTGASAGIGLATARRFARAGASVVLAARSLERLAQVEQELREQGHKALAVAVDMRDRAQVEQMITTAYEHFGTIDILINNAGQGMEGPVAEVSIEDFRQIIELNLFGPFLAMQAVIKRMRQHGGGVILNISSNVSRLHLPGLSAYASSKAALNLLSETAREELASENIRVITAYPGLTLTDFAKHSLGKQQIRPNPPAGIIPDTPEFVAQKILEAASKEPAEQFMQA
jgi:NAD(P)-dependent dehydrogenase (short-subunit alcohol dehydrogenase family)